MSSKPSPDGVTKLRELSIQYRLLQDESIDIDNELRSLETRKTEVSEEYVKTHTAIIKQLEDMDCKANGNWGWENRIAWMLSEFASQGRIPESKPLPA